MGHRLVKGFFQLTFAITTEFGFPDLNAALIVPRRKTTRGELLARQLCRRKCKMFASVARFVFANF
jgi:hypothetical protein